MQFIRLVPLILGALLLGQTPAIAAAPSPPTTRPSVFDPARHMRVSEVKAGMKGYGLSVFSGTRIERFEVEVLSVLKNFNPKYDVILVRCSGANLEHTGSIAGMSGSPIYLRDDQGRERMVGAFAYGWPLMKDPVGGVQPVEYMLALPESRADGSEGGITSAPPQDGSQPAGKRIHWSVSDFIRQARRSFAEPTAGPDSVPFAARPHSAAPPYTLRPLATPLMAGGLPPKLVEQFAPILRAHNLELLQAGGGVGSSSSTQPAEEIAIEPGSVLAVPMMTGDLNLTAIGTTTEVIDGRVFGFGHAMNNEGAVALPMGSGRINGVIANMMTSFKIGELAQVRGTLGADQIVGVAGRIGPAAPTVPIDLRLVYTDGTVDRSYHFDAALHPRLTAILSSVAVASALTGARELPQYNTLEYDLNLEFDGGEKLALKDTLVNTSAGEIFFTMGVPLIAAAENPFARVPVKHVTGTLTVNTGARSAQILSVNVPKLKYKPGETVKAYVTYRPFRQPEAVLPVDLKLPSDLPEGAYQFLVSGWEKYTADEEQTKPFRFTAESATQMFDAFRDIASIRRTALYVRLLRQPDGVAIGRTAMPALPGSRRQVLLEANRSNTTPFVSSTAKSVPTDYVLDGAADFEIEIERDGHASGRKPEPKAPPLPGRPSAGGPPPAIPGAPAKENPVRPHDPEQP